MNPWEQYGNNGSDNVLCKYSLPLPAYLQIYLIRVEYSILHIEKVKYVCPTFNFLLSQQAKNFSDDVQLLTTMHKLKTFISIGLVW